MIVRTCNNKSVRWLLLSLFLLCCTGISQISHAVEIMRWERLPLAIPLQVGHERVIFVERNVRVGVPSSLAGKLRVQSAGGSLYLLATEAIAPTRIQLQDAETGALILMDIAATVPAEGTSPLEPVQIIEGTYTPVRYGQSTQAQNTNTGATQSRRTVTVNGNATTSTPLQMNGENVRETPIPVILTRYAAQNLYAPLRTVEPITGVSQVNIPRNLNLQTLLPMLSVQAQLMAAWRLEDYWVSAVLLRNTSTKTINLDPRLLQGDFVAATFQHQDLGPRGNASDTTVVYLITQRSLAQSLLPAAVSQINASSNIPANTQGAR